MRMSQHQLSKALVSILRTPWQMSTVCRMNQALAAGQIEDVSQVIVASEKAGIAMQVTLQVRNKIVEAYQEVMRMQV